MPDFAHVQVRQLPCPKCYNELANQRLVGFQWGYCHGVFAVPDYQIGDAIKWRVDNNRVAYSWSYFKNGGGNIGDPNFFNLLVRESEYEIRRCRSCNLEFAGIGIRIGDGIIQDVRVYQSGLPGVDISIINVDGSLTSMHDWDDHPMPIVNSGWLNRLVPQSSFQRHDEGNISNR